MLLTLPVVLRPLASFCRADIVSLHDAWVQDYAPVTVLRLLAVLTHVFNVARKEWGMESLSNPIEVVQACGNSARQMQDGELEREMAAGSSVLLPLIIRLVVETAMRRGETVGRALNGY